jgi:hypothetical protein
VESSSEEDDGDEEPGDEESFCFCFECFPFPWPIWVRERRTKKKQRERVARFTDVSGTVANMWLLRAIVKNILKKRMWRGLNCR